jgi:predicted transcriptional regulator YdeE
VEWHSRGDMSVADYKSEIWIPVIKKWGYMTN